MPFTQNISLKPYNTFGVEACTRKFAELNSLADVQELLYENKFMQEPLLIIGGGSNIFFSKDFNGIVAKMNSKGILKISETDKDVLLNVQAGEVWDDFVNYCLQQNYGGVENLALIPGTVGSSPIQNIGAYGVEVKDVIESVELINIETLQMFELNNKECRFAYRDSIFKQELKGQVIILSVNFRLTKKHKLNTEYGAIIKELQKEGILQPTIQDIANIVTNIRRSKLPDPKVIGNAGSFFKNPSINMNEFNRLQAMFPDIPFYKENEERVKIPAAWLIEQCGWKGFREGDAGVHEKQALVLVNYGNAPGWEILQLAQKIQASVLSKFDIPLQTEVNII